MKQENSVAKLGISAVYGGEDVNKMFSHQEELFGQQFSEGAVLSGNCLSKRVEVVDHTLVLLDHVEAMSLLGGIRRCSLAGH
jgi:hypothetical protein